MSKKAKKTSTKSVKTETADSIIESTEPKIISEPPLTMKPKGKLTLTSMHVVATWEYDVENPECVLCHHDLMTPVSVTKNNQTKYENDVSIGTCKHGYHVSCINSWLKNGNDNCPKCRAQWKTGKNVTSSVYVYKSE